MNSICHFGQLGPVSDRDSAARCGLQLKGHFKGWAFALVSVLGGDFRQEAGRNTFAPRKLAQGEVSIFDVLNEFLHV